MCSLLQLITSKFVTSLSRYYYDCIRIHCEGDKILIPIHAYPVINSDKDEIFPKLIDMGKREIGKGPYVKRIEIECNAPVNFEYEVQWTTPHPDIRIEPLFGDIKGMNKTFIDVIYNPTSFSTANAEAHFRTTEFGSEPWLCKITGSA